MGHTVDVAFEMPYRGDASVWVINSDSRAMDPKLAAMKITSLMSHLPLANNPPLVIKKIDSTLRGNIGAEIEADEGMRYNGRSGCPRISSGGKDHSGR